MFYLWYFIEIHCVEWKMFTWNVYQFSSVAQSCLTLQPHGLQHTRPPCPSATPRVYSNSSIELVMPSNHLILCHPLLLTPSIFLSIRVFSNVSVLWIRWPKDWSFSFNISPSNEYSGLISFRIDWLDLLAVQWTLKSLLQHHSLKASIRQHSAFFIAQLSQPYMTTGKTIALTRWTFVGKVMSLLFNMLCRLVTAFKFNQVPLVYFLLPTFELMSLLTLLILTVCNYISGCLL